jgi:hypothetical protein
MRKLIMATIAAGTLIAAATVANAGYWVPGPYGPVYVCTITPYGCF